MEDGWFEKDFTSGDSKMRYIQVVVSRLYRREK
jgi:hypothetical protein